MAVTVSDVANTLGESTKGVSYLCTSSKINKWAKYKPFNNSKESGITIFDKRKARFGMFVSHVDDANGKAVFGYNLVSDGMPRRLGDFENYEHNAHVPMSVTIPAEISTEPGKGEVFSIVIDQPYNSNNITILDIFNTELDWYVGVLVYFWATDEREIYSSGVKLRDALGTEVLVEIVPPESYKDTYVWVIPIISLYLKYDDYNRDKMYYLVPDESGHWYDVRVPVVGPTPAKPVNYFMNSPYMSIINSSGGNIIFSEIGGTFSCDSLEDLSASMLVTVTYGLESDIELDLYEVLSDNTDMNFMLYANNKENKVRFSFYSPSTPSYSKIEFPLVDDYFTVYFELFAENKPVKTFEWFFNPKRKTWIEGSHS